MMRIEEIWLYKKMKKEKQLVSLVASSYFSFHTRMTFVVNAFK